MTDDEIQAEIRSHRDAYAARFGYDPAAIALDIRSREGSDGRPVLQPPARGTTRPDPLPVFRPLPAAGRPDQPAA